MKRSPHSPIFCSWKPSPCPNTREWRFREIFKRGPFSCGLNRILRTCYAVFCPSPEIGHPSTRDEDGRQRERKKKEERNKNKKLGLEDRQLQEPQPLQKIEGKWSKQSALGNLSFNLSPRGSLLLFWCRYVCGCVHAWAKRYIYICVCVFVCVLARAFFYLHSWQGEIETACTQHLIGVFVRRFNFLTFTLRRR